MTDKQLIDRWTSLDFNSGGHSRLHYAFTTNELVKVPKKVMTVENMLLRNANGDTPLMLAAMSGILHLVPRHLFTRETVLATDRMMRSTIFTAILGGCLCDIPYHLMVGDDAIAEEILALAMHPNLLHKGQNKVAASLVAGLIHRGKHVDLDDLHDKFSAEISRGGYPKQMIAPLCEQHKEFIENIKAFVELYKQPEGDKAVAVHIALAE